MLLSDITVEVRNGQYQRVGQILPQDLTLTATDVYNNVGQWTVKLRQDHPMTPVLATPGAGIVVTGPDGSVIFSGPMTQPQYDISSDQAGSLATFTGVTDDVILADRLAWPQPSNSDVTTQSVGFDSRTGPAETLMYQFVSANCGPTAPTARRNPFLALASDQGRGTTLTKQARFPVLGTLLTEIANVDGLGFDILQADTGLLFNVYQPVDRSSSVRLSVANGDLSTQTVQINAPTATQAIVGGAGQLTDRLFVGVSTSGSQSAETAWGRRIETFIDQRQYNGTNLMTQAGNDALAAGGTTTTSIQTTPSANVTFQYGVDYSLGDIVAVELADGTEAAVRVTGWVMNADESGFSFGVTLSDNAASLSGDYQSRIQALEQKVTGLQTTSEGTSIGVVEMFAGAAAPAGTLLCDGSAVSRTTYAQLFAVIGTAFGAGDGSTTFNVPDMRGRFPLGAGVDPDGTTRALGTKSGSSHISTTQMPSHSHTISVTTISDATVSNAAIRVTQVGSRGSQPTGSTTGNATTDTTGSGSAYYQPYTAINFIIHY